MHSFLHDNNNLHVSFVSGNTPSFISVFVTTFGFRNRELAVSAGRRLAEDSLSRFFSPLSTKKRNKKTKLLIDLLPGEKSV